MSRKPFRFALFATLLVILVAMPALAAGKRRAVTPSINPSAYLEFEIDGLVLDDVTGNPVVSVQLDAGDWRGYTGPDGRFSTEVLGGVPFRISLERSGYVATSVVLDSPGSHTLTIRLTPAPTVKVKRTNGSELDLDFESILFGYPVVFSGYVSATYDQFCRADGSQVTIDRSEMRKITGPAVLTAQSNCCSAQQLLRINMELKSGEKSDLYFLDSCLTESIDLIGREHVSGIFRYIRFTEIAEVVFP